MCADIRMGLRRLPIHVFEFAHVVVGREFGRIVEWVELIAGESFAVSVIAHPQFKAHAVAHRNEPAKLPRIANEPGRYGAGKHK
jgi:aromatic ring-cleaving dioxygenase